MTTHRDTELVERLRVTQADRDVAARLVRQGCPGLSNGNKVIADEIKGGLHDGYHVVQVIAKHRLDTIESQASLIREAIEALENARSAVASLPEDGLGMARIPFGTPDDVYPLRDELLAEIDAVLKLKGKHQ